MYYSSRLWYITVVSSYFRVDYSPPLSRLASQRLRWDTSIFMTSSTYLRVTWLSYLGISIYHSRLTSQRLRYLASNTWRHIQESRWNVIRTTVLPHRATTLLTARNQQSMYNTNQSCCSGTLSHSHLTLPQLKPNYSLVQSVVFPPHGSRVVSGWHEMTVRIWDVGTNLQSTNQKAQNPRLHRQNKTAYGGLK